MKWNANDFVDGAIRRQLYPSMRLTFMEGAWYFSEHSTGIVDQSCAS